MTLSKEEIEAIKEMIYLIETKHEDHGKEAYHLRNLLERTKNNNEQSEQMKIARDVMKQDSECLRNLSNDKKMKFKFKFILVVTDVTDSNERTKYFGPFDDGEKALEWGQEYFNSVDYFLMSTTLYDPND